MLIKKKVGNQVFQLGLAFGCPNHIISLPLIPAAWSSDTLEALDCEFYR